MGLAASQARLLSLTARKSDLEYTGQHISERRIQIASQIQDLYQQKQQPNNCQINLDDVKKFFIKAGKVIYEFIKMLAKKEDPPKDIDAKIKELETEDRKLELNLKTIDTQHNAVQTEYDGVKKVIDKNIETSFKTFGGGQ